MLLSLSTDDFVAFDAETGGLDSTECALLSIAAVPSWEAPPFHVYILPVGRLETKALEVNGYTPELWAARGAVTPKQALWEFQRWLFPFHHERRFEMAAHNAGFDLLFIDAIQARTGIDLELPKIWHCTKTKMKDAEESGLYLPPQDRKGKHHLDDLGRESGYWDIDPRNPEHDALQDAKCCKHGLLWLRSLQKKGRITTRAEVIAELEGRADG
jgi:DNA polymerase III epsilon subunit-like protein